MPTPTRPTSRPWSKATADAAPATEVAAEPAATKAEETAESPTPDAPAPERPAKHEQPPAEPARKESAEAAKHTLGAKASHPASRTADAKSRAGQRPEVPKPAAESASATDEVAAGTSGS